MTALEILAAAGASVPEVGKLKHQQLRGWWYYSVEETDAALLALAEKLRECEMERRQWEWVAKHEVDEIHDGYGIHSETVVEEVPDDEIAYLLARYAEGTAL